MGRNYSHGRVGRVSQTIGGFDVDTAVRFITKDEIDRLTEVS